MFRRYELSSVKVQCTAVNSCDNVALPAGVLPQLVSFRHYPYMSQPLIHKAARWVRPLVEQHTISPLMEVESASVYYTCPVMRQGPCVFSSGTNGCPLEASCRWAGSTQHAARGCRETEPMSEAHSVASLVALDLTRHIGLELHGGSR